ncbi:YrhA family protein [Listeria seeligeri]|uniref:YrhA family protein n=1 Tax=Listeria seeligeri TaxID=1640 RepID=UPI001624BACF|nr:YrhA family protein [Listeria seeligeri]MBC1534180.1 hypothetical protein [Listeria seeligeri]MBC1539769.1 hypothetical protein [Listeria seeligeri]MBC1557059.1 hypothetical protein [Listeria seeligeri]MBC1741110.1 hypothetical protein [Listeria seeligeri]MBC1746743.1 hypothetical protein [Listeria seeligeri]
MIQTYLNQIRSFEKEYGDEIPAPIKEEEIKKYTEWAKKFHNQFPYEDYLFFLKLANGLNFNGLFLYGLQLEDDDLNIQLANNTWRESKYMQNYVFIGEDSISFFVWNMMEKKYEVLDKPSGDVFEEYDNLKNLLMEALETALPS